MAPPQQGSSLFEDTPEEPLDEDQAKEETPLMAQDQQEIKQNPESKGPLDSQETEDTLTHEKEQRGKRKANEDQAFTPRRSRRLGSFGGSQEPQVDQEPHMADAQDGGYGLLSTPEQQMNSDPSKKKPIKEYFRLLEKLKKIEQNDFASSAELFQAKKSRKLLESAKARGEFEDVPEQAGHAAEGGLHWSQAEEALQEEGERGQKPDSRQQSGQSRPLHLHVGRPSAANQASQLASFTRERAGPSDAGARPQTDRVAPPVHRPAAVRGPVQVTNRDRVDVEKLQRLVKQLHQQLRHEQDEKAEKDRTISKLQAQVAEANRRTEVADLLKPKRIEAARKQIIKETLLGKQWWTSLYPEEETILCCFIAALDLVEKEDIKAFKDKWYEELKKQVMKLIRDGRQKLVAKFVNYLLQAIDCPALPPKPKPSPEIINERKAKMAQYLKANTWLHGTGRDRRRLGGNMFLDAAAQALLGPGATIEENDVLQARAEVLGLFMVGGDKALRGEKFDSRNVEKDRADVARNAAEIDKMCDSGKLTSKLEILLLSKKPEGKLRYPDYTLWPHEDVDPEPYHEPEEEEA